MNKGDASDLPEMRSAALSEAQMRALFDDIAACAAVQSIRLKQPGPSGAADQGEVAVVAGVEGAVGGAVGGVAALEEARAMLANGRAHGVQIRYTYNGREYIDTLLRDGHEYRLVRL